MFSSCVEYSCPLQVALQMEMETRCENNPVINCLIIIGGYGVTLDVGIIMRCSFEDDAMENVELCSNNIHIELIWKLFTLMLEVSFFLTDSHLQTSLLRKLNSE